MRMKKLFLLSLLLLVGVMISGCASEPEESSATGGGSEEEGSGSGGDLVIANLSDAVSLDPAGVHDVPSYDVQTNIFERLVKQDEDMELQPLLAESWEAIDDVTWEFKLQEGVTFHDGSEFNADLVKTDRKSV